MTTTTEAPPLDGMDRYYGVWVTALGEDGDLIAAGHHPPRRVVAAMNAYSRRVIGLANVADDRSSTLADIAPAIEQRWATRNTYADCDSRVGDIAEGRKHWCEMCATLDDGGWWITLHNDDRPGSFPVTWFSA